MATKRERRVVSNSAFAEQRRQFDLFEERYVALCDVVSEADLRTTDHAARMLLRFIHDAARYVIDVLRKARAPRAEADEVVRRPDIRKLAVLHRELTSVLAHVKPSPIPLPSEVALSFRRIVRIAHKNAELLITVGENPAFRLVDLITPIIESVIVDLETECDVKFKRPEAILIHVQIPSAEVTQVLFHCIFAHEFGHWFLKKSDNVKKIGARLFKVLPEELRETAAVVANAWLLEIAADLYAMFLFGPAYVFAAMYYVTSLYDPSQAAASHPPFWLRMKILIEALNDNFRIPVESEDGQTNEEPPWLPNTERQLKDWLLTARNKEGFTFDASLDPSVGTAVIAEFRGEDALLWLRREVRDDVHEHAVVYMPLRYRADVRDLVDAINCNIVPVERYVNGGPEYAVVPSILNAAWECFLGDLKQFSSQLSKGKPRAQIMRLFNDFLLKTLELSEFAREWTLNYERVERRDSYDSRPADDDEDPVLETPSSPGAVLTASRIRQLATIEGPGTSTCLSITPIMTWDRQAKPGNASIDLRLGQRFRVPQRTRIDSLDHISVDHRRNIGVYFDDHFVPVGDYLILHPRQFVLGVTLEWLRLPAHFCASVIGRSAWGRDGLIVATATMIHPRYAGVLTLELTNLGEIPIRLYPGVTIAQLVVQTIERPSGENARSAFMLSAYPRSADAAGDDREIIRRFGEARIGQALDYITTSEW